MIEKLLSNYKMLFKELIETYNRLKETLISVDKLILTSENLKKAMCDIFSNEISDKESIQLSLIGIDRNYSQLSKM